MTRWTAGNAVTLLENGEAFFPRVFEVIAAAEREVLLETFILFDDKVGQGLQQALLSAARRGAQVDVLLDGFGSGDLPDTFLHALAAAGVRVRMFDPSERVLGWRPNFFRRMHRKLVVVDGVHAFVGGINYSADHLADFGPEAKQDYAVELAGPVVAEIHRFMHEAIRQTDAGGPGHSTPPKPGGWLRRRPAPIGPSDISRTPPAAGGAQAMFVWRDNAGHRSDIERHYRIAIRSARERVVIANAYFFPGWRLMRQLRRAARRGVDVRLILQGEPDMAIVKTAAEMLYQHLLRAGVRIFEYCERPLHGKVALADGEWSTVGSSNLDPLSLSLNLEANVIVRDRDFNATLHQRLQHLVAHSCKEIKADDLQPSTWWRRLRGTVVFHLLRHYPSWAGWLPAHAPRLRLVKPKHAPADAPPEPSAAAQTTP